MSHFEKALENTLADKPLMAAMKKMSAPAPCSGSRVAVDANSYSHPALLASDLLLGRISLPAWIKCGKDEWRVTTENIKDIVTGILIAANMSQNAELNGGGK